MTSRCRRQAGKNDLRNGEVSFYRVFLSESSSLKWISQAKLGKAMSQPIHVFFWFTSPIAGTFFGIFRDGLQTWISSPWYSSLPGAHVKHPLAIWSQRSVNPRKHAFWGVFNIRGQGFVSLFCKISGVNLNQKKTCLVLGFSVCVHGSNGARLRNKSHICLFAGFGKRGKTIQ